ncbi:DUF294 nucleotidyltransferase-like domain-containing protein [Paenibacillus sp. CMAA1364]
MELDDIINTSTWAELRENRIATQQELLQLKRMIPIFEWISLVNHMHDLIFRRAVELCEQEMVEEGRGLPPVRYSFVVFGSAGRLESTMWSDQDNGLIISDELNEGKELYFEQFSIILCNRLAYLGYEKCLGKVMCEEPRWRQTLASWKSTLSEWRNELSWEPIRYLITAMDMRHISGDEDLTDELNDAFYSSFDNNAALQYAVLRNTVRHKATLNILGQVVTERFGEHTGEFDVKYGVYIPLVNFIRCMAIRSGVKETMTQRRLEQLIRLNPNNHSLVNCQHAFETAVQLRVSTSCTQTEGLFSGSHYISQEALKRKMVSEELRAALGVVRKTHRDLQRLLRYAGWRRI